MAITEYLPVAVAVGANVDTQAAFAGSNYQQVGFTTGTAKSNQANKVWRQSSMMGAAWGNLVVQILGQNCMDDGNLTSLVTQLHSVMTTIATQALNASGLAQRVTTLEGQMTTANSNIATLQSQMATVQSQYNGLAVRMTSAEGNIAANAAALTALTTRVTNLEGLYNTLNGSLSTLWSQFNSLSNTVAGLTNSVNNINGEIADLYNRVATNASNISGNTNSINSINGQIGGINSRLATHDSQIATLNGQIPPINSHLATLDSEVATAQNGVNYIQNSELPPINSHLSTLDQQVAQLMPTGSLANPGWVQLPNGLILQWANNYAHDTNSAEITRFVNFPRQFPNNCFSVQLTTTLWSISGGSGQIMEYQIGSSGWNTTGCWIYRARNGSNSNMDTSPVVFAIGN